MANLTIWEAVQQTDPKHTKAFTKGGGFSGTAINAIYQIRRATELWGPLGEKWGYDIVASDFVNGAGGDIIHILQINFRHPTGAFAAFGQTTFVGKNKNGAFTDEEAPKKSLTDAITKALSMLGFSADVFLGLYDDNKYVNDLRNAAAKEKPKSSISPNDAGREYWNAATTEEKEFLAQCHRSVVDLLSEEPTGERAAKFFYEIGDEMEKAAVWSQLAVSQKKIITLNKQETK